MEEADVEDDLGNITKELYVLQTAPLESHAGYRLETEDPAFYSDGGEDDPDGWVCTHAWPHLPIPTRRRKPAPPAGRSTPDMPGELSCNSTHTQLKKDLLLQHHNLVRMLAALGIDACKEYRLHNAQAVLSHVRQGNKTCSICQRVCSGTQALKVHIRGQHMEDSSLQCDECDYTAGDKHGLDLHQRTHLPPESRFQCDQCPKSYSQKWHLKQHQKEHLGRFGPCPHCRATFAQKSGLVAHLPRCPSQEGGAPEKPFSCEICSRKYSRKSELTRHLRLKH